MAKLDETKVMENKKVKALKKAVGKKGLNVVAKEVGIARTTLQKWVEGTVTDLSPKSVAKLNTLTIK